MFLCGWGRHKQTTVSVTSLGRRWCFGCLSLQPALTEVRDSFAALFCRADQYKHVTCPKSYVTKSGISVKILKSSVLLRFDFITVVSFIIVRLIQRFVNRMFYMASEMVWCMNGKQGSVLMEVVLVSFQLIVTFAWRKLWSQRSSQQKSISLRSNFITFRPVWDLLSDVFPHKFILRLAVRAGQE